MAKSLSLFFLLVLLSSLQIDASDRLFFSKVTGSNSNYNARLPDIPLGTEQETKASTENAALTTGEEKVAVDPPKEPSFSNNQYGGYGLYGSTEDKPSNAFDTSAYYKNDKSYNNDNNEGEFIYNMESDFNGNGNGRDDEIKHQGFSDTMFSENGPYFGDLNNEIKNSFNSYETERTGSWSDEGYAGETVKPHEFDTLEEYEKYLQRTGYLP